MYGDGPYIGRKPTLDQVKDRGAGSWRGLRGWWCPVLNPNGIHVHKVFEFDWKSFTDQPWAEALVKKMLQTQGNISFFWWTQLRVAVWVPWATAHMLPSETQSGVLNISLKDWMALKGVELQKLSRWGVVQIHACSYVIKLDYGILVFCLWQTWHDLEVMWWMAGTLVEFLDEQTEVVPAALGGETPVVDLSDVTFTTLALGKWIYPYTVLLDKYQELDHSSQPPV
ncbi:hypothetical protein GGX14DRAFT_405895 [Mycena pura]|uniref:Uncharacterized protein n=1 Tax=Mycena pura TaxID=153505 RepID=A0AAD6UYF7_9AGAR|nr:hypothetical protein GGX14DRAFT_405895 [Mycena pura]